MAPSEGKTTIVSPEPRVIGDLEVNSLASSVFIGTIIDYCSERVAALTDDKKPTKKRELFVGISTDGDIDYMKHDEKDPASIASASLLKRFHDAVIGAGLMYNDALIVADWFKPNRRDDYINEFHDDPAFVFCALTFRSMEYYVGLDDPDPKAMRMFVEGIPETDVRKASLGEIRHYAKRSLHRQEFVNGKDNEDQLRIMLRGVIK